MDASKWLAIVGVISALALGIGFVTALISAGLGWIANRQQKAEVAQLSHDKDIQIEKVRTAGETEAKRIETEGKERLDAARRESNEKIAGLTMQAEAAKAEIAIAKADAAKAKEGTANAEARSREATAEVSRLQVIVENAEQRRAEAELALAEVRRKQAPRQLSIEKFLELLRESLRTQAPHTDFLQQRITVLYQREDTEAFAFAAQIASALREAGWNDVWPPEPLPSGAGGPPSLPTIMKLGGDTGLTVVPRTRINGAPEEDGKPLVSALLNAFAACGIEAKLGGLPEIFGNLKIIVGPKP